jgi:hypothetical protein
MIIHVSAADLKLTCKYKAGVIPFDDVSVDLTYKVYGDDTVDLAFKKNAQLAAGYDMSWQHAVGFSGNFVYAAKEGGGYQCPDINTYYDMGFVTVDIGNIVDETHKKAELVSEKVEGNNPGDIVTVTNTCSYKVFNKSDNKLDFSLDIIKLQMDSKGGKYIYINDNKGNVNEFASEVIDRLGTVADFTVKEEDVPKLFIQNFQMLEHNTFTCPSSIFIVEESFSDRRYFISTTSGDYKYYMKAYDIATYNNNGNIVVDPKTGDPIDCSDFVTNEGVNIISELFNIIMIIGPILALVLGGLDFAKATLASDENALKKAGTNFGKRIAAAILLFLLPLIINLVLGIAFSAGVFGNMENVPSVCLTSK